jgi:hypothetical protein
MGGRQRGKLPLENATVFPHARAMLAASFLSFFARFLISLVEIRKRMSRSTWISDGGFGGGF